MILYDFADSHTNRTYTEDITGISDFELECCPILIEATCDPTENWKQVAYSPQNGSKSYCLPLGPKIDKYYEFTKAEPAMAHTIADGEEIIWFREKFSSENTKVESFGGPEFWTDRLDIWYQSDIRIAYKATKMSDGQKIYLEQMYGECGIFTVYTPIVRRVFENQSVPIGIGEDFEPAGKYEVCQYLEGG